jgi:hypothetical protein
VKKLLAEAMMDVTTLRVMLRKTIRDGHRRSMKMSSMQRSLPLGDCREGGPAQSNPPVTGRL